MDIWLGVVFVGGCCFIYSVVSFRLYFWSLGRRCSWVGGDRGWGRVVGAMILSVLGIYLIESG